MGSIKSMNLRVEIRYEILHHITIFTIPQKLHDNSKFCVMSETLLTSFKCDIMTNRQVSVWFNKSYRYFTANTKKYNAINKHVVCL